MATFEEMSKLIKQGFGELNAKLGIEDGQSLNDVLHAKLGIEDGQSLKNVLDANNAKLIDELDAKFDVKLGIGDGNSVNLPNMERELHDLFSTSPDAFLGSVASNVVGMGTPQQDAAVRAGGMSTWTCIKCGETKMAIGAAHCGLRYKLGSQGEGPPLEFVEIPEELAGIVDGVLLLPRHRFGCRPDHDDEDVVVLLLESFPEGVVPAHVVEWRAFDDTSHESLRKAQIGGKTLSGSVRGTGCAGCAIAGKRTSLLFVEDSGEAGNSGALMYNINPQSGRIPFVIGVYLGICRGLGRDLKKRGRICPLPKLENFRLHRIAEPLSAFQLKSLYGKWRSYKCTDKTSLFKEKLTGREVFGVFTKRSYDRGWAFVQSTVENPS
jgi:hypothetical protein